jgi:hypothetical protein
MPSTAQQTGTFIISILLLLISIASIIGLYWLTAFAFTAKSSYGDKTYTVTGFTKNRMRLSQLTVVLIWLQTCLTLIGVLWSALHLR